MDRGEGLKTKLLSYNFTSTDYSNKILNKIIYKKNQLDFEVILNRKK